MGCGRNMCVGGVANWAVYTTIYKALIMQKADPTQQSPNWPYYIVLGFFSLPALDDQLQIFLLLRVNSIKRVPIQGHFSGRGQSLGAQKSLSPHSPDSVADFGHVYKEKSSFFCYSDWKIRSCFLVACLFALLIISQLKTSAYFEEIFSNYCDLMGFFGQSLDVNKKNEKKN